MFTLFQIDAFADKLFTGNPAAVVTLDSWLSTEVMQNIAMENNLAETAFFVPAANGSGHDFDIRWFTPGIEINLCGHATLASGFVLFEYLGFKKDKVTFSSKSGLLSVQKQEKMLQLDFPSWMPERIEFDVDKLSQALGGVEVIGVYKHRDIVVELNTEDDVQNCQPDFTLLKKFGDMLMITAPGKTVDYVCRFFAPTAGIDEDPVTGSAHSQLIPFWAEKLGKDKMIAKQLSRRGGTVWCEQHGDRVMMGGTCVFYMQGNFNAGDK